MVSPLTPLQLTKERVGVPIPYVLNNGNLGKFLEHIKTARVPNKLDDKFLQSAGFTGKNDLYLRGYMKSLGFTDRDGTPNQRWHDHRHEANAPKVRAKAVREAYSGFFDLYPDAHRRPAGDFENWARAEEPTASPTTISRALKTFEAMVKLSDFEGVVAAATTESEGASQSVDDPVVAAPRQEFGMGGITINIELQLPPTADAEFFDAFFASMRKHLKDD